MSNFALFYKLKGIININKSKQLLLKLDEKLEDKKDNLTFLI